MKTNRMWVVAASLLALQSSVPRVTAQVAVPPMTASWTVRSDEQLEQLLGPIALYPDPLIAQILPAATLPEQIVQAHRYVQQGLGMDVIDQQAWDPSVKALARYPSLLEWMDTNLGWTTDVGQSFLYQGTQVMNSVQRLRGRAIALGNLQSTAQQTVINNGGVIEIVPANPQIVYVPVYQPQVVYSTPAPRAGLFVSFGVGVSVGSWFDQDCDWQGHQIIHWRHSSPRPSDWWYRRPGERAHVAVINNNVTVVNTHNERVENARVWRPSSRGQGTSVGHRESAWQSHAAASVPPHRDASPMAPAHRDAPRVALPAYREAARPVVSEHHDLPRITPPAQVHREVARVEWPIRRDLPRVAPPTAAETSRPRLTTPRQAAPVLPVERHAPPTAALPTHAQATRISPPARGAAAQIRSMPAQAPQRRENNSRAPSQQQANDGRRKGMS